MDDRLGWKNGGQDRMEVQMTVKINDRMEEWMAGQDGSIDDCEDKGQDGRMDDRIGWKYR